MKIPRNLGGRELADGLCRHWAYREVGQTGSHIILQTEQPSHQRIPIPAHKSLRVGTLSAILRLVANHKAFHARRLRVNFSSLAGFASSSP
jgi:predicted RNA binding protein YcfA (HicA-like mRNA interferase family)